MDSTYGEPRHKELPGRPSPGQLQGDQFNQGISGLETFRGQADDLAEPWQALITGRTTASVSWRHGGIGEGLQKRPPSSGGERTLGCSTSRGSDGCVSINFFPILLFLFMILTLSMAFGGKLQGLRWTPFLPQSPRDLLQARYGLS